MENIIINFTADPAGLQPGIDGLVQLEVVDRSVASQAVKTMESFNKRDKAISDSANKSGSSIEKFSSTFKNLDKIIIGGTFNKAVKELAKYGDEFKQLSIVVDLAKKKLTELKPNSKEWKELNQQINTAETLLKQFVKSEEAAEEKTVSFKTKLRQLKEELSQLEAQGKENTTEFQQLAIEAARLEDQIGDTNERIRVLASDTANIDALVEGVGLLATGFQLASGASALFGDENEEVQKALIKLNAIMAITQSLQQAQNFLRGQSILKLRLESAANAVLAASTRLTAGAYTALGISVNATSTSFKVLRAAIVTTGIGALIVGVGFLIEKLMSLSSASEDAADGIELLNAKLEYQKTLLDNSVQSIDNNTKIALANAKARGASEKEMNGITVASIAKTKAAYVNYTLDRIAQLRKLEGVNKVTVRSMADAQLLLLELEKKVAAGNPDKIDEKRVEKVKTLLKEIVEGYKGAEQAQTDIIVNQANFRAEQAEEARAKAKQDAEKALQLQKEAAAKAKEIRLKGFEDFKAGVQLELLAAEEGSREYLALKKKEALAELQIQLENDKLTHNQRKLLVQQYFDSVKNLSKSFYKQEAEDAINQRIAQINEQLSTLEINNAGQTNEELLQLKQDLIDEQAELEILSIEESVKNEELRRAKINAVYAKALADKKQLERDKVRSEVEEGLKEATSIFDDEIADAQRVLESTKTTTRQKRQAQDDYFRFIEGKINAEQLANEELYAKGLISYNAYIQRKRDLDNQYHDNKLKQEQDRETRLLQVRDLAIQASINLTNAVFSASKNNYDEEERRIKELYDLKKISEKEYNNQLRILRIKQAEDEKAQAIFSTLVNQGPALLRGFKDGGFAGVAAAFTLFFSLLNAVTSTKIPQFWIGTKKAPKGFKWVGEKGPELIYDGGGYPIMPHEKSKQLAGSGYSDQRILREYNIPVPNMYSNLSMPPAKNYSTAVSNTVIEGEKIDYNKLGDIIAQKLAENPTHQLSFDENGFTYSIIKNNEIVEYKNKKLNT